MRTYFDCKRFNLYRVAQRVACYWLRLGPLPVSRIHLDISLSCATGRFHDVLRYVEAVHHEKCGSNTCTPSEQFEPRPLRLPFLVPPRCILCGTHSDHVAFKQQRAAHETGSRYCRGFRCGPSRRHIFTLAAWLYISSAQLHVSDDHIYCHVHRDDCFVNGQLGISLAREWSESEKKREHA